MLTAAITGGIACGKSLVGSFLSARGIPVCDSDSLAHEAMRCGSEVHAAVVNEFGPGIIDGEGNIERRRLADIVFKDAVKLSRLNSIVHPAVIVGWKKWLKTMECENRLAFVIVPLLFEIGAKSGWDSIVCVACDRQLQMERMRERGLCDADIVLRLKAQMPVCEKARLSDYVLFNNGTREWLEEQTEMVLKSILEKK